MFASDTSRNSAETGFYYVSSRYYDPEIGRFINADTIELVLASQTTLTDKNLYAYCDNNPVMRIDKSGEFWNVAAGAVIGAGISMAFQMFDNYIAGNSLMDGVLLAAVGGGITGGLAATGAPRVAQAIVSGIVGAGCDLAAQINDKERMEVNWGQVAVSGVFGAISGYIGKDGIRHKGGDVAKATTVYDLAIDGIKNRTRTGDIASQKLISASNNLAKAWVQSLNETTARFAAGSFVSTTIKRGVVKALSY